MLFIQNIKLDKKKRLLYKNIELYNLILKSLFINPNFSLYYKLYFYKYFYWVNYGIKSVSYFNNNCNLTGLTHCISKKFKINRFDCKKYSGMGLLMGIRKSSF